MHRPTGVAGLLLGMLARTAAGYDIDDWPTHYRFDDGTDIGLGANVEGDINTFNSTSELGPAQRDTLHDAHGMRREEFSAYIRKPDVYEAQWGWDYWNKTYVDVYARVYSKAFFDDDYGNFRVGYFKTYVGFEGYTRTRNDTFLETALPISAFYEGRRTGGSWEFERPQFRIDLAAYGGEDLQGDNDGTTFTGRIAWTPFKSPGDVLHLGITASDETPDRSTINGLGQTILPNIRVRTRPDVFLTSARFVDTGTITNVDHIERRGLEGVWIGGPWSVQGEYLEQDVHRNLGKPTVGGSGGYVFGSWVLTGESRIYESGQVTNLKPEAAWGAVELLARYDEVDLNDVGAGVHGGKQHNCTLGANWYVLTHFRVQANYIWAHEQGNPTYNAGRAIDPRIFGLRFQIIIETGVSRCLRLDDDISRRPRDQFFFQDGPLRMIGAAFLERSSRQSVRKLLADDDHQFLAPRLIRQMHEPEEHHRHTFVAVPGEQVVEVFSIGSGLRFAGAFGGFDVDVKIQAADRHVPRTVVGVMKLGILRQVFFELHPVKPAQRAALVGIREGKEFASVEITQIRFGQHETIGADIGGIVRKSNTNARVVR